VICKALTCGAVRVKKSKNQFSFIPKPKKEHGGSLAVGKRRAARPLKIKQSHHVTLKSHHAVGPRSLFRHKKMILSLINKNSVRFQVKVYEYAIQGNHIHLLVKAQSREGLQNFFRVFAGHAQRILKDHPLKVDPGSAPADRKSDSERSQKKQSVGCQKNQRVFWSYLLYSRVVSWGREFKKVAAYVQKNTLELLQIIAYQPRLSAKNKNQNSS
jgi:REP element-mobilizing transposase RayT